MKKKRIISQIDQNLNHVSTFNYIELHEVELDLNQKTHNSINNALTLLRVHFNVIKINLKSIISDIMLRNAANLK